MKKLLALLLVLVMVFTLAACGNKKTEEVDEKDDEETTEATDESTNETEETKGEETEPEKTEPEVTEPEVTEPEETEAGTYVMISFTSEGKELSEEDILDLFGEAPMLILNGDGTGTMTMAGGANHMAYDATHIWIADDADEETKETYEINGREIRIYDEENEMIFSKISDETEEPNEPVEVEGDIYYCIGGLIENEVMSAADLDAEEWYIVITGEGTGVMYDGEESCEIGFEDGYMWETEDPEAKIECEISEDEITLIYGESNKIFFEK